MPLVGPARAGEAAADALIYAWQRWDRVRAMDNRAGYLYQVGRRAALCGDRRLQPDLQTPTPDTLPDVEPALVPALLGLSEMQRRAAWLVEACGWTLAEAAEVRRGELADPERIELDPARRPRFEPLLELRLGDGTAQHQFQVAGNCAEPGLPCDHEAEPVDVHLRTVDGRLTADGRTTGTSGLGTVYLPNEPVKVTVDRAGHWCPTIEVHPGDPDGWTVGCTRLDRTHAVVTGRVSQSTSPKLHIEFPQRRDAAHDAPRPHTGRHVLGDAGGRVVGHRLQGRICRDRAVLLG